MGLLRFLIISIAVLYIIRFLSRLLLPLLFQKVVKKAQQQYNHTASSTQNYNQRPEGSIKVEYIPPRPKTSVPDTEGEFVEYEELKK
jgi:hypothetical protein